MIKNKRKERNKLKHWYNLLSKGNVRNIVGIDNGVTGTIGHIHINEELKVLRYGILKTPTIYTDAISKKRNKTKRIDTLLLQAVLISNSDPKDSVILLERPMLNPTMFWSSISAAKSMEVTQAILEILKYKININYFIIDSRDWQSVLLPGIKGSTNLKRESFKLGQKLFPNTKLKHSDMDGLLIAEWFRKEMCV